VTTLGHSSNVRSFFSYKETCLICKGRCLIPGSTNYSSGQKSGEALCWHCVDGFITVAGHYLPGFEGMANDDHHRTLQ
jgi:hypothetical protein